MNYSDKLPRQARSNKRCQEMDSVGERCRYHARFEIIVHSDPEIDSGWYAVLVCAAHVPGIHRDVLK